jgi:hypothetical protein
MDLNHNYLDMFQERYLGSELIVLSKIQFDCDVSPPIVSDQHF